MVYQLEVISYFSLHIVITSKLFLRSIQSLKANCKCYKFPVHFDTFPAIFFSSRNSGGYPKDGSSVLS